jgi:SAM-dependent methyltransferase
LPLCGNHAPSQAGERAREIAGARAGLLVARCVVMPRRLSLLSIAILFVALAAHAGEVTRKPAGSRVKLSDKAKAAMGHRERAALYRSARRDLARAEKYRVKALGKSSENLAFEAHMHQALRYRAAVKVARAQGKDGEAERLAGFEQQATKAAAAARHDPMSKGGEALFRHDAGSWARPGSSRIEYGELKVGGSGMGWKADWIRRDTYKKGSELPSTKKYWGMQVRNRPIDQYRTAFGADAFDEALAELDPSKTWLDSGAGQGRALANYLAMNEKLGYSRNGTAAVIAVDLDGEPDAFARQFHPTGAKGLRKGTYRSKKGDITRVKIDRPVDLLTDFFGPLSFNTHTPDVILRRYGELVPPGGRVMIVVPARGWNTVISKDGTRSMDLMDLIRRTPGFRAERPVPLADPVGGGQAQSIVLHRTDEPVVVPRLELVKNIDKDATNWDASRIPERTLRIVSGERAVRFPER